MQTRVQRWGNSLALRIPKAFAEEAQLRRDSLVELTVEDGVLSVRLARRYPDLKDLLAQVTPENLHREIEDGPAVGHEAW